MQEEPKTDILHMQDAATDILNQFSDLLHLKESSITKFDDFVSLSRGNIMHYYYHIDFKENKNALIKYMKTKEATIKIYGSHSVRFTNGKEIMNDFWFNISINENHEITGGNVNLTIYKKNSEIEISFELREVIHFINKKYTAYCESIRLQFKDFEHKDEVINFYIHGNNRMDNFNEVIEKIYTNVEDNDTIDYLKKIFGHDLSQRLKITIY